MIRRARAILFACAMAVACAAAGSAAAASGDQAPAWPGKVESHVYSGEADFPYLLYTPSGYDPKRPAPLVLAVHGCMTTADQFMNATRFNEVAEREGFVVAYLDVEQAVSDLPQPLKNCWRFYDPATFERDQGHAAAVAGMTRQIMKQREIDPERVYMAGTSAGGFMTAAMAAAYPDIYAAVSIVAGGAYQDVGCLGPLPGSPVDLISANARAQMGPRARIVPRMTMGGERDEAIPPHCVEKALQQGLRTNNLVLGDSQTSPISLEPASSRRVANSGGYDSTVETYLDPQGCVIAERWLIDEMNHFWPGGPADAEWKNFTDPKGPSGAQASWDFFARYARSETSLPCAEAKKKKPTKPKCAKRRVTVALPKRTRSARATVNGRKVATRIVRGRLRVWLPAGNRKKTVIRVKGRKKAGKKLKRRYAFGGCGPRREKR